MKRMMAAALIVLSLAALAGTASAGAVGSGVVFGQQKKLERARTR